MEKTKYNENQSVFKVGELPDKMYLLVKGSVGIFLPTNETKKPNFIIQDNYWKNLDRLKMINQIRV